MDEQGSPFSIHGCINYISILSDRADTSVRSLIFSDTKKLYRGLYLVHAVLDSSYHCSLLCIPVIPQCVEIGRYYGSGRYDLGSLGAADRIRGRNPLHAPAYAQSLLLHGIYLKLLPDNGNEILISSVKGIFQ